MSVEFCPDCGWDHADIARCWRRLRRLAREKLADPAFTGPLRDRLQAALDNLENERQGLMAFFAMLDSPGDEFEQEVLAAAAIMQQRAVDHRFELLTQDWTPPLDLPVPMPGECHPAYLLMPWLKEWLDGKGPYASRQVVLVAKPARPQTFIAPEAQSVQAVGLEYYTLYRQRCGGPAPYVGRPFVYEWFIAVDELGRALAGRARIVYLPPDPADPASW
jgi:hypothetical protein